MALRRCASTSARPASTDAVSSVLLLAALLLAAAQTPSSAVPARGVAPSTIINDPNDPYGDISDGKKGPQGFLPLLVLLIIPLAGIGQYVYDRAERQRERLLLLAETAKGQAHGTGKGGQEVGGPSEAVSIHG